MLSSSSEHQDRFWKANRKQFWGEGVSHKQSIGEEQTSAIFPGLCPLSSTPSASLPLPAPPPAIPGGSGACRRTCPEPWGERQVHCQKCVCGADQCSYCRQGCLSLCHCQAHIYIKTGWGGCLLSSKLIMLLSSGEDSARRRAPPCKMFITQPSAITLAMDLI